MSNKIMKKLVTLLIISFAVFTGLPAIADMDKITEAFDAGDYKTVARETRPLAEQGDAGAQNFLGKLYAYGFGVPQNFRRAIKWYKLSAEQGNADAQFALGMLYSYEASIPKDYPQTLKWITLAAEQGHAKAQTTLGGLYVSGAGVPKDYIHAHMWFNIAVSSGQTDTIDLRDLIAEDMTQEQIEKAQDLAEDCVEKDYKNCSQPAPKAKAKPAQPVDINLSQAERNAVVLSVERCWNPPAGVENAEDLRLVIGVDLNRDGTLASQPVLISPSGTLSNLHIRAFDAARRAINRCAPFSLPANKYETWKRFEMTFDPNELVLQ